MIDCCHREGLERQFGRRTAAWELRRFRRRGARATTRILVDGLRGSDVRGSTLVDIGGGIGAIHHDLLDAGAAAAVHVDVAPEYLRAAAEEASRRGHAGRVRFVQGDFVELAASLDAADVVTLDRVICCYPDMEALVGSAAAKARRLLGAVYPRDSRWVRAGIALVNLAMRIRGSSFRVFLHPPAAIHDALARRGLERRLLRRTPVWEVVVYSRRAGG